MHSHYASTQHSEPRQIFLELCLTRAPLVQQQQRPGGASKNSTLSHKNRVSEDNSQGLKESHFVYEPKAAGIQVFQFTLCLVRVSIRASATLCVEGIPKVPLLFPLANVLYAEANNQQQSLPSSLRIPATAEEALLESPITPGLFLAHPQTTELLCRHNPLRC